MKTKIFKTPKQKQVTDGAVKVLGFAGGGMVSRAASKALERQFAAQNVDTNITKGAVAAAGLLLSLGYNGPQKDIVQNVGAGMAVLQTAEIITGLAQKNLTRDTSGNALLTFRDDMLGLAGDCGCGGNEPQTQWLGAPAAGEIETVVWNRNHESFIDMGEAQEVPSLT